jgi:hypothetical protein
MLNRALIDSDEVLTETATAELDTVFIWPAEVVDLQDWRIRRAGVPRNGLRPSLRKYVPRHRAETTRWS